MDVILTAVRLLTRLDFKSYFPLAAHGCFLSFFLKLFHRMGFMAIHSGDNDHSLLGGT